LAVNASTSQPWQDFESNTNEFLTPEREDIICIMISDLANNQREYVRNLPAHCPMSVIWQTFSFYCFDSIFFLPSNLHKRGKKNSRSSLLPSLV
jgi:hypothetical protein